MNYGLKRIIPTIGTLTFALFVTACGRTSSPGQPAAAITATDTPPQGKAALNAWLATGAYKSWACEPAPVQRQNAHGRNRVCSNPLASAAGPGEYPVGAASVKELYDANDEITGYAVSSHVAQGKTGASWYWFERVGDETYADGLGDAGPAKQVCAGCHKAAGATAGTQSHDFVYVQVR